jgi:hypothetical protein
MDYQYQNGGQQCQRPAAETDEASATPSGCSCGFCDGVTVQMHDIDPTTGAAEDQSFQRMSRRSRCPVCGGINLQYRASYTAHVASVVSDMGARRCDVYDVTVVLDAAAADAAGIDGDESYQVLTGRRGVWTRARRAMRRRDSDLTYMGTLSARPSDGRYHIHAVIVSRRLCVADLRESLHVAGLDGYVTQPRANESAERFGARRAAYAWDNTARAASSRFISSRGQGEGYDSAPARKRRRDAARAADAAAESDADDAARARSPSRNEQRQVSKPGAEVGASPAADDPAESETGPQTTGRAPPVECDGQVVATKRDWIQAARRAAMRRIGTRVHVTGMGAARLLRVVAAPTGAGLVLTVSPEMVGNGKAVDVRFREVRRRDVPRIRSALSRPPTRSDMSDPTRSNDPAADDADAADAAADDPVDRFNDAAETSRVTVELSDGRRRVTIKNHRTGETREKILPPRDERR